MIHRLPRFRDKKKHLLGLKTIDQVPYDPPLPDTMQTWKDGCLATSNRENRQPVAFGIKEKKIPQRTQDHPSGNENKTIKQLLVSKNERITNSPRTDDMSMRKNISQMHHDDPIGQDASRSDDERITSVKFQDLSEKKRQIKRQMSPQADRFVPLPPDTFDYDSHAQRNPSVRFADLLPLSYRRVTMLDKSTQCDLKDELNDLNRHDAHSVSRVTSTSVNLVSPMRSRLCKTNGVTFTTDTSPDSPRSLSLSRRNGSCAQQAQSNTLGPQVIVVKAPQAFQTSSPSSGRNITHEIIEETISISNASSDEFTDIIQSSSLRIGLPQGSPSFHTVSKLPDAHMTRTASQIAPSCNKEMSPRQLFNSPRVNCHADFRATASYSSENHPINNDPSPSNRCADQDYRKSMAGNAAASPFRPPPPPPSSSSRPKGLDEADRDPLRSATLNRLRPQNDFGFSGQTVKSECVTGETVHAFTLDRKHLDRRKKAIARDLSDTGLSSEPLGGPPGFRKVPSPPDKGSITGLRRFASTRDISGYQSEYGASISSRGYRRGGLAAAFKERQARASSLNHSIGCDHHASCLSLIHEPTGRHDPRANHSIEFRPRTRSFLNLHQIQAEVHNEPNKSVACTELSARHQPDSQRRSDVTSTSRSREQRSPLGVVTFASPGKQYFLHPSKDPDHDGKKKKDLKRTQSIPKDAKFPWLARLRMKVKARDP